MKNITNHPYKIAIAGTTDHTTLVAQSILNDPRFEIAWILTPKPKPIGRKKTITKNPLHIFAQKHNIEAILVEKKLEEMKKVNSKGKEASLGCCKAREVTLGYQNIKKQILEKSEKIDFLMVVDFGYFIPKWLLELPKIHPLNIHPSDLPAWRGTSPGQYVLLSGRSKSAVSLMIMNDKFDQGPIVYKETFKIEPNWTQSDYYNFSFDLICQNLPTYIDKLAKKEITAQDQPIKSPTPLTRRFSKQDGFIDWNLIKPCITQHSTNKTLQQSDFDPIYTKQLGIPEDQPLIMTLLKNTPAHDHPLIIERAVRAFSPWPTIWTQVKTSKGIKKMKILELELVFKKNNTGKDTKLTLLKIQIEGKTPTKWNEIKNTILL